MTTGIDDLDLYASTCAVSFDALCDARGWTAAQRGQVGFDRRSVCPPWEDPVTLAANAASALAEEHGEDIGLLLVATETALDFGKPLSTWVHGALGLPSSCRNLEVKHACYGGTAALQLARGWLSTPAGRGRKALVVMVDVARRHFGEMPELTAGTGSVALVVSEDPRLFALDDVSGIATHDVHDVSRPGPVSEIANPLLSLSSYLDLLEEALADWQQRADEDRLGVDHVLYHAPLVSLVREAHRTLLEVQDDVWDADAIEADFTRRVAPSLELNRRTGNLYSGSLYASLASLILGGRSGRVGMFSYGSGACAEWLRGRVVDGARERLARRRIVERLDAREAVEVDAYEAMVRSGERARLGPDARPERDAHFERAWAGSGRRVLEGVEGHVRSYGRV